MSPTNTLSKIQNRAYELFIERNGQSGSAQEDWFKAEQEITGQTDASRKIKKEQNNGVHNSWFMTEQEVTGQPDTAKKVKSRETSGVREDWFKAEQRVPGKTSSSAKSKSGLISKRKVHA